MGHAFGNIADVVRGFVVSRGDTGTMMDWLERSPGTLSSKGLWTKMYRVGDIHRYLHAR
jgi:hypothetical protein